MVRKIKTKINTKKRLFFSLSLETPLEVSIINGWLQDKHKTYI